MQKVLLTMKFYYCLVVLISLNLVTVVPTSKADPTTSEVYESMLQRTTETFDMMKVLVTYIGKIVMHPLVVSRAMPTVSCIIESLCLNEYSDYLYLKWVLLG